MIRLIHRLLHLSERAIHRMSFHWETLSGCNLGRAPNQFFGPRRIDTLRQGVLFVAILAGLTFVGASAVARQATQNSPNGANSQPRPESDNRDSGDSSAERVQLSNDAPWGEALFGPSRKLIDGEPLPITKTAGLVYRRTDSYELKCDVYSPVGPGPFPAILAVHGGGWRWGSKFMMTRHGWLLAKSGYVVIAINYRHAPEHPFPAQIQDCRDAIRWVRTHASELKVDPDCIGAYGYSAGAQMVSLLATSSDLDRFDRPGDPSNEISTRVQAVVAGGAPCEFSWVGEDSFLLKYWLGSTRRNRPQAYFDASPTNFVSADDPPFFFYHGQYDPLVPRSSPLKLHQRLSEIGIESSFRLVPNADHVTPFSRLDFLQEGVRFFDRHLK